MYEQEFKSPGEALKHYGVKGMRWGKSSAGGSGGGGSSTRTTGPRDLEIDAARKRTDKAHTALKKQGDKAINRKTGALNEAELKKYGEMKADWKKNGDRITANRIKKGEAVTLAILGVGLTPAVPGVVVGARAAENAVVRRNIRKNTQAKPINF